MEVKVYEKKRIIFDIDGTLIQKVDFSNAIEKTLKKIGMYSEENVSIFLSGIPLYEQNYDHYNVKDYLEHFSNLFYKKLDEQFLNVLFGNLKMLVSSENEELIATLCNRLKEMEINAYFKEYYGEKKIKPYKEAYLAACGDKKLE